MKKTTLIQLLIIIALMSALLYVACENGMKYPVSSNNPISSNNKESFRGKPVQYTKHARCLMNCKHISEKEIEMLIAKGKLNSKESFPKDKPCPTFALEGFTNDSQNVRVIVGECAGSARVITVIDLAKERKCNCR